MKKQLTLLLYTFLIALIVDVSPATKKTPTAKEPAVALLAPQKASASLASWHYKKVEKLPEASCVLSFSSLAATRAIRKEFSQQKRYADLGSLKMPEVDAFIEVVDKTITAFIKSSQKSVSEKICLDFFGNKASVVVEFLFKKIEQKITVDVTVYGLRSVESLSVKNLISAVVLEDSLWQKHGIAISLCAALVSAFILEESFIGYFNVRKKLPFIPKSTYKPDAYLLDFAQKLEASLNHIYMDFWHYEKKPYVFSVVSDEQSLSEASLNIIKEWHIVLVLNADMLEPLAQKITKLVTKTTRQKTGRSGDSIDVTEDKDCKEYDVIIPSTVLTGKVVSAAAVRALSDLSAPICRVIVSGGKQDFIEYNYAEHTAYRPSYVTNRKQRLQSWGVFQLSGLRFIARGRAFHKDKCRYTDYACVYTTAPEFSYDDIGSVGEFFDESDWYDPDGYLLACYIGGIDFLQEVKTTMSWPFLTKIWSYKPTES